MIVFVVSPGSTDPATLAGLPVITVLIPDVDPAAPARTGFAAFLAVTFGYQSGLKPRELNLR